MGGEGETRDGESAGRGTVQWGREGTGMLRRRNLHRHATLTTAAYAIFSLRAGIAHRTRLSSSWRDAIDAWCNAYARIAEASVKTKMQQACENALVSEIACNRVE